MNRPLLLVALLAPGAAFAQDLTEGWTGRATLYGWLTAAEADTAIALPRGGSLESSVSAGIDDILDVVDFAAFGTLEARRDRLILYTDLVYTKLSTDGSGPAGATVSTGLKTFLALGAVGWRAWSEDGTSVDAFGGARYVYSDVELARTGRAGTRRATRSTNFVDPVIGARVRHAATERLDLIASADIGGFGLGSEFSWEAYAGTTYAFTDRVAGELGFRYLSIDYEKGRAELDLQLFGPVLGLVVEF